jgi:ribosomal protein S6
MAFYECVFIARQDISSQQVDGLSDEFAGIVEAGGGKVTKRESWGLRNLAYKIKKNRKGHYMLFNIDAPSEAVLEMERNMRLNEDVLRYLTVRVEEVTVVIVVTGATAAIAATAPSGMEVTTDVYRSCCLWWRRRSPSLFPPPQVLPLLRPQRAEDRLQGHEAHGTFRLRARQDRSQPHHGCLRQEAA